ncbi:MAG: protein BatD, partial [Bacteroidales bacterium]|nr:protein BatD [Bacteroidales bacterium]
FSIRRKNRADQAGMKNRKATKFAKRRLAQAATYLKANQIESFYEEVSDALWGYVGDKLNIPFSVLNTEQVKEKLASSTVPDMVIERFLSLVAQCDYARFSPGDLGSGMQAVYSDAVQIITQLEKYLKKAA